MARFDQRGRSANGLGFRATSYLTALERAPTLRYSTWLKGHYDRDRKLVAILCSDVVGCSRLAGADEDPILARLRALRSDLIDPTITVHKGRVVKRTGDGSIVEFRS